MSDEIRIVRGARVELAANDIDSELQRVLLLISETDSPELLDGDAGLLATHTAVFAQPVVGVDLAIRLGDEDGVIKFQALAGVMDALRRHYVGREYRYHVVEYIDPLADGGAVTHVTSFALGTL